MARLALALVLLFVGCGPSDGECLLVRSDDKSLTDGPDGYRHRFWYDDAGRLIAVETRPPSRVSDLGEPRRNTYEYDADDRLVLWETDQRIDGRIEHTTVYEYDERGRLLSTTVTGDLYANMVTTYVYDDAGDATYVAMLTDDDSVYSTGSMAYDDAGNVVRHESTDSVSTQVDTYGYDGQGNLVRHEKGFDDVTPYQIDVYSYDDQGRLTMFEARGSINDEVVTYEYGADGLLATVEFDVDGDGELDTRDVYFRDRRGNVDHVDSDWGLDGTAEFRARYRWRCSTRI
jgi:YD repeat-containing protein